MLVRIMNVAADTAPGLLDPDGVCEYMNTHEGRVFVDDNNILTAKSGEDIDVGKTGALLVAKDRSTMVHGLTAAGHHTVKCNYGTVVVGCGRYSSNRDGRLKRFLLPRVSLPVAVGMSIKAHTIATGTRHMLIENRLKDRGYFVLIIGRAAFNAPPPKSAVVYMNDYTASFQSIVARLRDV